MNSSVTPPPGRCTKATDEPSNSPRPGGAGSGHPGSFHPAPLGNHQDPLQTPHTNTPAAKSGTAIREKNTPIEVWHLLK